MRDAIRDTREALGAEGKKYNHYLVKGDIDAHDGVGEVERLLPYLIAGILGVSFVVLTASFGSFLVPIRSVISLLCTASFCFGAATFVYEDGLLNSLHLVFLSTSPVSPGFYWIGPVIGACVMIGIGLDCTFWFDQQQRSNVQTCKQCCRIQVVQYFVMSI